MRFVHVACVTAASLVLAPRLASACGSSPPTEWKLTGVLPTAGTPVPIDGAVLVTRESLTPVGEGSLDAASVVVHVYDATATVAVEIPGTAFGWLDAPSTLVWMPKAPLPPNGRFRLEATVGAPSSAPATTEGLTVSVEFATSGGVAPPVQVMGELAVTYEAYDEPILTQCPSGCGYPCPPSGQTMRRLRARMTIPPVQGGFAPDGYLAWLWVSDQHPHNPADNPLSVTGGGGDLGGLEHLVAAQPTVVTLPIPVETGDYTPCLATRAFDPVGHFADTSICLPKLDVAATIASLSQGRDSASNAPPVYTSPSSASGGCAISGAPPAHAWGVLVALALVAVARRAVRNPGRATGTRRAG
jgi:hypothetical protein